MRHFGDAEVGQSQTIVVKQDEILRLDIAVNDPIFVGMSDRIEYLPCVIQRRAERDAAA